MNALEGSKVLDEAQSKIDEKCKNIKAKKILILEKFALAIENNGREKDKKKKKFLEELNLYHENYLSCLMGPINDKEAPMSRSTIVVLSIFGVFSVIAIIIGCLIINAKYSKSGSSYNKPN